VALLFYVRYRQVETHLSKKWEKSVYAARLNQVTLLIGLLSAFGISLLASFTVCLLLGSSYTGRVTRLVLPSVRLSLQYGVLT